ncbi:MAG TPA: rod shape-determining protein MreC, partial [Terriglobia bacterium]|nr:rod shape-determining protein MreC [Terriglobia bacterium]
MELRDQLDRLKLENHRLRELAEQGRRLQALFALREQAVVPSVAAQVLSAGSSETARIVLIDKGANDGLTADLPVMVPDGVVGKVLHVFPSTAQVILITDPYSGVAALLGDSRIHGIVKGQNQSECVLAYVPNGDPVQPGQIVYTSGEDRIFPKGLPVGVVVEARPGVEFQQIKVRPLAKLNRLEEVLVLLQSAGEVAAFQQAAGAGDHDA